MALGGTDPLEDEHRLTSNLIGLPHGADVKRVTSGREGRCTGMASTVRSRRVRPLLAALLTAATALVVGAQPVRAWAPVAPPQGLPQAIVGPCTTAEQLDCIESIGATINGTYVAGTLTGRTAPTATGGVCCHEWRIPGLVNEDGNDLVETQATLDFPGTPGRNAMLQFEIHASTQSTSSLPNGFRVPYESGSTDCTTNKINGVCYRYGNTQRGVEFQAVLRTSWMLPSAVTPKAGEVEVVTERLTTDGASRVTVSGVPYDILGVDSVTLANFDSPTTRGAWKVNRFAFVVLDTRFFGPAPNCAELPTLVVADNSWAPSVPRFDAASGVLSLQIGNPHYDTDGTTVFSGKYQATIPLSTAKCMWGDSVNESTRFTLTVTDPTDPANTPTTSVTFEDGAIVISADGFHYSSPTISVKPDFTTTITPTLPATGGNPAAPLAWAVSLGASGLALLFTAHRRRLALHRRSAPGRNP